MNFNHSWDSSQYTKTSDLQAGVADNLIQNLRIKPDENVLDIGCGIGNITMEIAAIANNGTVLGIDESPSMVDQACKNLSFKNLRNVSFQVMRIGEMRFGSQFDVVFSNSVLHWVKNQRNALEAIYRCLKPGGRIGLQFPLLNGSHPMIRFARETIESLNFDLKYSNWEFPWFVPESATAYSDLLKECQFKNVTVWEVETFYMFENGLTALNFFNLVGFNLFMQPLSKKDGTSLKDEVRKRMESCIIHDGIKLSFHRLYAQADL